MRSFSPVSVLEERSATVSEEKANPWKVHAWSAEEFYHGRRSRRPTASTHATDSSIDSAFDLALAASDPETRDAWEAALWADERADETS